MKKFYPVIHVWNEDQVYSNLEIAKNGLADGVFLINHGHNPQMSQYRFGELTAAAVSDYQSDNFEIGINLLNQNEISIRQAFNYASAVGCRLLWVDNAGTDEEDISILKNLLAWRQLLACNPKFFAGVHFKYQPQKFNIFESVRRAQPFVDVITLSGPATGHAAKVEKIQQAFEAAKNWPLALASGVSLQNVTQFLPYIDNFLVASSLINNNRGSKGFVPEMFDRNALQALSELIHKENKNEAVES